MNNDPNPSAFQSLFDAFERSQCFHRVYEVLSKESIHTLKSWRKAEFPPIDLEMYRVSRQELNALLKKEIQEKYRALRKTNMLKKWE